MDNTRKYKIEVLSQWLGNTLIPKTDPYRQGNSRTLPDPVATANFILDMLEQIEIEQFEEDCKQEYYKECANAYNL